MTPPTAFHPDAGHPDVSVVVAAQAAPLVGRQLAALHDQRHSPAFTVTVVLAPGDDQPAVPPVPAGSSGPCELTMVRGPLAGAAAARNLGARNYPAAAGPAQAGPATTGPTGAVLLFCDADDTVGPDWVATMTAGVRSYRLVGGPITINWYGSPRWTRPLYEPLAGNGLQVFAGTTHYVLAASMGIERALFDQLGGFDPTFPGIGAEDVDLCLRATAIGVPPRPATGDAGTGAGASIFYQPRTSFGTVVRQRMSYARGAAHLATIHKLPAAATTSGTMKRAVPATITSLRRTAVAIATTASFHATRRSLRRT